MSKKSTYKEKLESLKQKEETKEEVKSLDWDKAEKYLKEITEALMRFAGLPGMNPFRVLTKIEILKARYKEGERSDRLYNEIMALEKKEPRI